jgi:hypothetical protein
MIPTLVTSLSLFLQAKLADGTPFAPLARRMLDLEPYGMRSDLLTATDSQTVQSAAPKDAQLSLRHTKVYDIVYLGKTEVSEVLHMYKDVVFCDWVRAYVILCRAVDMALFHLLYKKL